MAQARSAQAWAEASIVKYGLPHLMRILIEDFQAGSDSGQAHLTGCADDNPQPQYDGRPPQLRPHSFSSQSPFVADRHVAPPRRLCPLDTSLPQWPNSRGNEELP